jgi:hypothetical protein
MAMLPGLSAVVAGRKAMGFAKVLNHRAGYPVRRCSLMKVGAINITP